MVQPLLFVWNLFHYLKKLLLLACNQASKENKHLFPDKYMAIEIILII